MPNCESVVDEHLVIVYSVFHEIICQRLYLESAFIKNNGQILNKNLNNSAQNM